MCPETTERYAVRVLGHFLLREGTGQPVALCSRPQQLLGLVAVRGEVSREQIAALLWPDHDDSSALCRVRDVLYKIRCAAPGVLETGESLVRLSDDVRLDLAEARQAALRLTETAAGLTPGQAAEMIDTLSLRLLPGWGQEWLAEERRAHAMLRLRTLEALGQQLLDRGEYALAEQSILTASRIEPYRETTQVLLASVYAQEGNGVQALQSMARFSRVLRTELGVPLGREAQHFVEQLRGSDAAGTSTTATASRTATTPRTASAPMRAAPVSRPVARAR